MVRKLKKVLAVCILVTALICAIYYVLHTYAFETIRFVLVTITSTYAIGWSLCYLFGDCACEQQNKRPDKDD